MQWNWIIFSQMRGGKARARGAAPIASGRPRFAGPPRCLALDLGIGAIIAARHFVMPTTILVLV